MTQQPNQPIVILGIGCTLFADQGFGVHLIQILEDRYSFPENVQLVDGGLVGVAMVGVIARAAHLIVVDAVCNDGRPGDIYRFEGPGVLERLTCKNNVQQVEFLEALAHCQALDHPPRTVLLGIEPEDTQGVSCTLTPLLQGKTEEMAARVLAELDALEVSYQPKEQEKPCA